MHVLWNCRHLILHQLRDSLAHSRHVPNSAWNGQGLPQTKMEATSHLPVLLACPSKEGFPSAAQPLAFPAAATTLSRILHFICSVSGNLWPSHEVGTILMFYKWGNWDLGEETHPVSYSQEVPSWDLNPHRVLPVRLPRGSWAFTVHAGSSAHQGLPPAHGLQWGALSPTLSEHISLHWSTCSFTEHCHWTATTCRFGPGPVVWLGTSVWEWRSCQRPWLTHLQLGVRAAHSGILHLRVVRFSVLVSSLDEGCVALGPARGGDGGMCVYGGDIGPPPTTPSHFGPRRHLVVPRRGQLLVHPSRPQHWGRADLEGAGQRKEGKQEDLIHHCWWTMSHHHHN